MKLTKDIILDELSNQASDHVPKSSLNGPNTLFSPNPMRGSFSLGSRVLAKCEDGEFRGGVIISTSFFEGESSYSVKLHSYHSDLVVFTKEIR